MSLIEVGDTYFVRDGHHRISVARAMGQADIEAEVVVWEVDGPPPWAAGAGADASKRPTAAIRGLRSIARQAGSELQALLSSLRRQLPAGASA